MGGGKWELGKGCRFPGRWAHLLCIWSLKSDYLSPSSKCCTMTPTRGFQPKQPWLTLSSKMWLSQYPTFDCDVLPKALFTLGLIWLWAFWTQVSRLLFSGCLSTHSFSWPASSGDSEVQGKMRWKEKVLVLDALNPASTTFSFIPEEDWYWKQNKTDHSLPSPNVKFCHPNLRLSHNYYVPYLGKQPRPPVL